MLSLLKVDLYAVDNTTSKRLPKAPGRVVMVVTQALEGQTTRARFPYKNKQNQHIYA
jgi:hypothetical protein